MQESGYTDKQENIHAFQNILVQVKISIRIIFRRYDKIYFDGVLKTYLMSSSVTIPHFNPIYIGKYKQSCKHNSCHYFSVCPFL